MINLSVVSYLNARPFVYGLRQKFSEQELTILESPPAQCAMDFMLGKSDIALIPVAAIADLEKDYFSPPFQIANKFCIGANGKVDSVFLFANQPVDTITTVYLDSESKTSNKLVQILFKYFWKRDVDFIVQGASFEQIQGCTAGVVIGDKALTERANYLYAYDLADEWKKWTLEAYGEALPFVFAVWVYYSLKISEEMMAKIEDAFEFGVSNINLVLDKLAENDILTKAETARYLTENIDFRFDELKNKALGLFLLNMKTV